MNKKEIGKLIMNGRKEAFPNDVEVMLAQKVETPFNDADWIYELKLDGYRMKGKKQGKTAELLSRGSKNYTRTYAVITKELLKFKSDVFLDGEVVIFDVNNRPNFNALQNYSEGDNIQFYVFDLIWLDGYNICDLTLLERRSILKEITPKSDIIKFSEDFEDGLEAYRFVQEHNLEGLIAKQKNSCYCPGKRVSTWKKIPVIENVDYIIGGWVDTQATGRAYGTLMLGHYVDNELQYIGLSSHGMSDKDTFQIAKVLKQIEIREPPFGNPEQIPRYDNPKHWVQPLIVGEFKQKNMVTPSGERRHQITLIGISDKKPEEIVGTSKLKSNGKRKTKSRMGKS